MPTNEEVRAWYEAFRQQQGREPTQEDYQDWLWSQQFARTYGRPPTMDDWRAHWYSSRGFRQSGTEGGETEAPQTVGDLLGLRFPAFQQGVPSYIRDWVRYLQETVQANPNVAPTNPLATKVEEGQEATPFQQLQQETAAQLGLRTEELADADLLKGWQDFIDSLKKAPFEAQKSLLRFRWDAEKGWHEVQIPDMPNPREL